MARRFQFTLRTAFWFMFAIAIITWPTTAMLRRYLAMRGLVPVTGVITLKGQPIDNATITLSPAKPGTKAVKGTTNTAGRFELETLVSPGPYGVVITDSRSGGRVSRPWGSAATSSMGIIVSASGPNRFDLEVADSD